MDRLIKENKAICEPFLTCPHDEADWAVNFQFKRNKAWNFLMYREVSGFFFWWISSENYAIRQFYAKRCRILCRAKRALFAFAQRSGAMKAPVGLLSDRTILRKQDGGAPPRQVRVWCKNRAWGGWVQTCKGLRQKADLWICKRTAGTFHRSRSKCEKHGGFLMNKLRASGLYPADFS